MQLIVTDRRDPDMQVVRAANLGTADFARELADLAFMLALEPHDLKVQVTISLKSADIDTPARESDNS